jgi:hypothetical protein
MPQHPLVNLIIEHTAGRDVGPHRQDPPTHLTDRTWKYNCECGMVFKHTADAVWRNDRWQSPRRQCLTCHTWLDGRDVTG